MIELKTITTLKNNPRKIRSKNFKELVKSIKEFPKMLEMRPIIVDDNNVIIGGNQRYKALIDIGYKEVPDAWVRKVSDLTEEQKKQFVIKDNLDLGEFTVDIEDFDVNIDDLRDLGLKVGKDWGAEVGK